VQLLDKEDEAALSYARIGVGMRKLVIALIALLALFTFIRDFPSATPSNQQTTQAEIRSPLIP
jgi:hypothetical protein